MSVVTGDLEKEVVPLLVVVDSGCPKTIIVPEHENLLSHVKDLKSRIKCSFGNLFRVGWLEGTINNSLLRCKCYVLAPVIIKDREGQDVFLETQLAKMGFHLLLGTKALKANEATVNFATKTITFPDIDSQPLPSTTTNSTTTAESSAPSTSSTTAIPQAQ